MAISRTINQVNYSDEIEKEYYCLTLISLDYIGYLDRTEYSCI